MKIQKSFNSDDHLGKLYLVPTPIGNLADFSFRAVEILKQVDLIASEDTRNTLKLLNHFQIKKHQISFHQHNFKQKIPQILQLLSVGKQVAQVSDAGMPLLSDPGQELVATCLDQGYPVISIPGATASLTALIASGLSAQPFTFYGFLPRKKKEQLQFLTEHQFDSMTQIFYESPFRVKETIKNIGQVYGSDRKMVLARELTKIHEEYLRGSVAEILSYLLENNLKGEFCLVVAGSSKTKIAPVEFSESIRDQVERLITEQNLSTKEAISEVAKIRKLKKRDVYQEYHQLNCKRLF